MYVVVVEFTCRTELATQFLARVQQQARDSLALESDCQVFDICEDYEHENQLLLYEVYSNEAAFTAHLQSTHFVAFNDEVQSWVIDKKVKTYRRR